MKILFQRLWILLLVFIVLFSVEDLYSADTVIVGTPQTTSYGYCVPYYYYGHDVTRFIITKTELGDIGSMVLKEIAFKVQNVYNSSYPGHDTLSIYMRHVEIDYYTGYLAPSSVFNNSYFANDYELVYRDYSRTINKSANEWDSFEFDDDFEYNGVDNLEVLLVGKKPADYSTSGYYYYWMFSTPNQQMNWCGCYRTSASGTYSTNTVYKPHTLILYEQGPELKEIFAYPSNTHTFATSSTQGEIYTPYVKFKRRAIDPLVKIEYKILDPNGDVVFEALDPITGDTWLDIPANLITQGLPPDEIPVTYYFKKARGFLADTSNPDTAKVTFRKYGVLEGNYTIISSIRFPYHGEDFIKEVTSSFEVVYDYDIAMTGISEPLSYSLSHYKYPFGNIPLRMSFLASNKGKNPISNFVVRYKVENKDPSLGKLGVIWSKYDTMRLQTPLERGSNVAIDIDDFIIGQLSGYIAGTYYVTMDLLLLDADEENISNNSSNLIDVRLEYPYDGITDLILFPTPLDNIYKNQICKPVIRVRNAGAFSVSEVPLRVEIEHNGVVVYDQTEYINFLAEFGDPLQRDIADYTFITPFVPSEEGQYTIKVTISTEDDSNPSNNVKTGLFSVKGSLKGDMTVGKNYTYKTLESAIEAIYERGVDGTVNIVLSDPIIEVGSLDSFYALDFSSSISGFDKTTDTIRIVPSKSLSRLQGGVTLRLSSSSGIGIRFSSSINPFINSAPVHKILYASKRSYYPFNANLEIDGGPNKSIRFVNGDNPTSQTNNVLLYFGEGASNITLRNCILEGLTNKNTNIPLVLWNRERNEFSYDPLSNLSSCIMLRNLPPMDENGLNRSYSLDTIRIHNINIVNNSIVNGGYGIVSIGIGALYNSGLGKFERYYNSNNLISNNEFIGQCRSGIYLGYESDSKICNNRIYKIGYAVNSDEGCGIILGGEGKVTPFARSSSIYETFGYNNINITLDGNEISHIRSTGDVYGIKIEQERNNFYDMHIVSGKHPYMPDVSDNIHVYNNLVWHLEPLNKKSSRYGIRLFTTRDKEVNSRLDKFAIQKELSYNILGSSIINNSVLIDEDGYLNDSSSYLGGIVVQNVDSFSMYNNAINILDSNTLSDVASAFVLESVRPDYVSISIDNNIYNTVGSHSSLVRYIELSNRDNSILSYGYKQEFSSLEQWQYWTNKESATTSYDFTNNLYDLFTKSNIPLKRIKSPVPIGSYLNNRGKVCLEVSYDIDKKLRGSADQGYDIGAWEFDGQLYDNDLGILSFESPVSYRDNREGSLFNDAEYVMTVNPISVRVNIRNNGSVMAENRPVTLTIYNHETGAEVLKVTEYFTIGAFELKTLDFRTDDKRIPDNLFNAVPYGIGNSPLRFSTMSNNVTPVYRFVVELPVDEDMSNNTNTVEKLVRFYIKKSNLHLLLSGEYTNLLDESILDYYKYIDESLEVSEPSVLDQIVGYTNYKSLRGAFEQLGYKLQVNTLTSEGLDSVVTSGFDVFDRSNWEIHSVDYSMYNSLFWSDGLNSSFSERNELEINSFLSLSTESHKRNLVISSEELARNSYFTYFALEEPDYFQNLFNTKPLGTGIRPSYFDNTGLDKITGSFLATGLETGFKNTPLLASNKDVPLVASIFDKVGSSSRVLGQAYYYTRPEFENRSMKTMGTVSYSLQDFLIYLGLDWRHYTEPSFVLGSIIDFIDRNSGSIVPVELLSFEVSEINHSAQLTWETASEFNSSLFSIERKLKDGISGYSTIGSITTVGNSMTGSTYSYLDKTVSSGSTYVYRLRLEDLDGSYSYSPERELILSDVSYTILEVVPNPVTDYLHIKFNLTSSSPVRISLVDMLGEEVCVIKDTDLSNGTYDISYEVSNLTSGFYNVIINIGGTIKTEKISIVK